MHLDTADRRTISNHGLLDFGNVRLALRHALQFAALLLRRRPDAVYLPISQNRFAFLRDLLFVVPSLLAGIPVIAHVHGGRFPTFLREADAVTRALVKSIMRRVARAIVLGQSQVGTLATLVPASHIAVVPNAIPDVFGRAVNQQPAGPLRVLYLSSLMPAKGYRDFIAAAQSLQSRSDLEFVLAGELFDPADAAELARLEQSSNGQIRYVGVVTGSDKEALLRGSHLFVLPTYYDHEGHPYVLLEAMAAGLAIVTTDHATIAETARADREALLVPKKSPRDIAVAIERLADDLSLRERISGAARERYLEQYTYDRWTARMAEVFGQVAARPALAGGVLESVQ